MVRFPPRIAVLLSVCAFAVSAAVAAPPANDQLANATVLTGNQARLPSQTTVEAAAEPAEGSHGGLPPKRSVWYRFTAPASGTFTVSLTDSINLHATLYKGSAYGALTVVSQTQNDLPGGVETLSSAVQMGETLSLAVDSGTAGEFHLEFRFAVRANDFFVDAAVLSGAEGTVEDGTNADASNELDEPVHGAPGGRSVWFTWTAPFTESVTFDTYGSGFDTVLAVYTGNAVGNLQLVAANNDTSDTTSRVTFNAVLGITYRIAVAGADRGAGPAAGAFYLSYYRPNNSSEILRFALGQSLSTTEGNGPISIRVVRLRGANSQAEVSYRTQSYTATAGEDYTDASGKAFFLVGETSKTFVLPIRDDAVVEPTEFFGFFFSTRSAIESYAYISINENDHPPNDAFSAPAALTGSIGSVQGNNFGTTLEAGEPTSTSLRSDTVFTRSLWFTWTAPSQGVVEWTAKGFSGSADLQAPTALLYTGEVLNELQLANGAEIYVSPISPGFGKPASPILTRFVVRQGAQYRVQLAARGSEEGFGTLSWRYVAPPILEFTSSDLTVREAQGSLALTLVRSGGVEETVTVNVATSDGTAVAPSDYTAAKTAVTFAPGEVEKSVTIALRNDREVDPDESFTVSISQPTPFGTRGARATVTIKISDDDRAGTIGFATREVAVQEGAGEVALAVQRVDGSSGEVSVYYSTLARSAQLGADFAAVSGTLTFAEGETQKMIAVPIADDAAFEAAESFQVILTSLAGDAAQRTESSNVTILDDDPFFPRRAHHAVVLPPLAGGAVPGWVTFDSLPTGVVSGQVRIGMDSFRFRGALDERGKVTAFLPNADGTSSALVIQFTEGADHFRVSLTESTSGLTVSAEAARAASGAEMAPQAGYYTALLESDAAMVEGYGVASFTVGKAGAVRIAGTLADGSHFSAGGLVDIDGAVPLIASLLHRSGFVGGAVRFREISGRSDADGMLRWSKPARPGAALLPGESRALSFQAARYAPPLPGQRALASFDATAGAGLLTLAGGGLPDLARTVTLTTQNRLIIAAGEEKLSVTLNAARGLLRGLRQPSAGRAVPFQGVLYQKQGGVARGSFTGRGASGSASLATGNL